MLDKIQKELSNADYTHLRSAKRFAKKLMSPAGISDASALLAKLERLKTSFGLALEAKSVHAVVKLLHGQELAAGEVRSIKDELVLKRELESRIALDEQKTKVVKFLRVVDPRVNHEVSLKLRFPGTGQWFEEVQAYKDWKDGSKPGLWIYGIPGAGKTVLTSSIIRLAISECNDNDAVAYFYCNYKDAQLQKAVYILGAIAVQIALRNELAFKLLE